MKAVRRSGLALLVIAVMASSLGCAGEGAREEADEAEARSGETELARADEPRGSEVQARARWGRLPLRYEENRGQHDGRVRYLARQGGLTMFVTDEGPVLALRTPVAGSDDARLDRVARAEDPTHLEGAGEVPYETTTLRMRVEGARPDARLEARRELITRSNYFIGNDPSRWRTDIPNFGEVAYREIRPGVDLVLHGSPEGRIEYDFVVAPDAATDVSVSFEGADEVHLAEDGALEIRSGEVVLRQPAPVLYQEVDGRRVAVAGAYRLAGPASVGFEVGAYDTSRPLVIDPVLFYSTYLGGAGSDVARGVVVDAAGAAYVAGQSTSPDFPIEGSVERGISVAFVAKLSPSGDALVYATYLGGSGTDRARDLAVDTTGAVYLTGETDSTNFPTEGALQSAYVGGVWDAFVAKLTPSGDALVYATYLGGSGLDIAYGVAVDTAGAAYVVGQTTSPNFPIEGALQPSHGGGLNNDAFVAKLTPSGEALAYSTYLGGSSGDFAYGVAVDGSGAAYIVGRTDSANFPIEAALQSTNGGGSDAFVAKLTPLGDALAYATYLGGSGDDSGVGLAVDGSGAAYAVGYTRSTNFPTEGALQSGYAGGTWDAFVAKLTPSGNALAYSTYLGGSEYEHAHGVTVDATGAAYVVGFTDSTDFPIEDAFQSSYGGGTWDAFVAKLTPSGNALAYSTYLGGSNRDQAHGVAVDPAGAAYVVGHTDSTDFPTEGALHPSHSDGTRDGFVVKLAAPIERGGACTADAQCETGHCTDGVCCESTCTGQCEACDVEGSEGTCAAVTGEPRGDRDACTGAGTLCGAACDGERRSACTFPGAETECRPASCAEGVATFGEVCDGAGACPAIRTVDCTPFTCGASACDGDCEGDEDCTTGAFCGAGVCLDALDDGEACGREGECASGHCVDGVCCESLCEGQCEACDGEGSAGVCVAVSGSPRGGRAACASDGTTCGGACDGEARGACAYPGEGTSCTEATCAAGIANAAGACNGEGSCHEGATMTCGPYACGEEACLESCVDDGDCAAGFVCRAGGCQESIVPDAGAPIDAGTSDDAGAPIDAGTSDDAGVPPELDAGCGCRTVGVSSRGAPALLGLLLILGLVLRRRRSGAALVEARAAR